MNLGPLGGRHLEVAGVLSELKSLLDLFKVTFFLFFVSCGVIFFFFKCSISSSDGSAVALTQRIASQCGFRMKTSPLGNAALLISLQNCFAHNVVMRPCKAYTFDLFIFFKLETWFPPP